MDAEARPATAHDMASLRAGPSGTWAHATRVAFHEAGHSLAEVIAGRNLTRVELFVAGDRFGGWGSSLRCTGGECEAQPGGPSSPATLVAGAVAEQLAGFSRRDDLFHTSDFVRAEQQEPGFDPLRATDEARRGLKQHWQAVAALAGKLLEKGSLGCEAEEIIRAHLPAATRDELRLWGPLPEPLRHRRGPPDLAAEQVDDREEDLEEDLEEYAGETVDDMRERATTLGEEIDKVYVRALAEGRHVFSASEQAALAPKVAEFERLVGLVKAFESDEEFSARD